MTRLAKSLALGSAIVVITLVSRLIDRSQGAASAHRSFSEYRGPSLETFEVPVEVGFKRFMFPRNFIVDLMGLTIIAYDLAAKDGLNARTFTLWDHCYMGCNQVPSLIRIELTDGSTTTAGASHRLELGRQVGSVQQCGLSRYSLGKLEFIRSVEGEPVYGGCSPEIGQCDINFDLQRSVGVRVDFGDKSLCQWQAIRDSVQTMLLAHETGMASLPHQELH